MQLTGEPFIGRRTQGTNMSAITDQEVARMKEIRADPIAKELLGAKCQLEYMSCYAVVREWGDPRTWHGGKVYKEAAAAKQAVANNRHT